MRPHTITDFKRLGKRKLGGRTAVQAKRLHDSRQQRAERRFRLTGVAQSPIPLGQIDALTAEVQAVKDRNKRLKNWKDISPSVMMDRASDVYTRDEGRYSSRCTYTHYTYTILIRSWGQVFPLTGKLAFKLLNDPLRVLRVPRGYRWDVDKNGIRLVQIARPHADYHPTAADLVKGVKHCVEQLQANRRMRWEAEQTRRAAARKVQQEKEQQERILAAAVREGLHVCLADSRRAGHCEAGTINWGLRHGFEPTGHYTPNQLLAVANGDTKLVLPVIAVALRRHQQEMRQGFSVLAEHRST